VLFGETATLTESVGGELGKKKTDFQFRLKKKGWCGRFLKGVWKQNVLLQEKREGFFGTCGVSLQKKSRESGTPKKWTGLLSRLKRWERSIARGGRRNKQKSFCISGKNSRGWGHVQNETAAKKHTGVWCKTGTKTTHKGPLVPTRRGDSKDWCNLTALTGTVNYNLESCSRKAYLTVEKLERGFDGQLRHPM